MDIFVHTREIKSGTIQYFGLDENKKELFKNTFNEHSGIVEFIGCVHALMYLKKTDSFGDVYIHNEYIQNCIQEKKYKHNAKTEKGREALQRAMMWLYDQKKTIIVYINK